MKKKNVKGTVGTYSDELGTGLAHILSEETVSEGRKIVERDKTLIIEDIKVQINRLEVFLKNYIWAIPKVEDLANWIFDKKKITQTRDSLPRITDEEIIFYTKEYLNQLKNTADSYDNPLVNKEFALQWIGTREQLSSLYKTLIEEKFISPKTSLETFTAAFSNENPLGVNKKILWLKMGLNKMPNKKSISDLIDILIEKKLIEKPNVLTKVLSNTFCTLEGNTKFTHSNLAKEGSYSEYRKDLEKIVENL